LTGFGPFVAVYLTSEHWTQFDIGLVLTTGSLVALVGQVPGGALVDAVRSPRFVAGVAVAAIGVSALALATWPVVPVVAAAAVLQAAAACGLGPAIAAISLGLVGHAAIGARLGRNARFASLGTAAAAVAMGASGYFVSNRSVFFVTAGFVLPTLVALSLIREKEIDPERAHGGSGAEDGEPRPRGRAVRPQRPAPRAAPARAHRLCRLRRAVPTCERRDVAADGRRRDGSGRPVCDGPGSRQRGGAATRRRRPVAVDRAARPGVGTPACAAARLF